MKLITLPVPDFFVDSLPDIPDTHCRELLRSVEIHAHTPDIFVWLKQLSIAPYSYDFIDNSCRKSPDYIIENLPPLKVNTHYLLSFHIFEFLENSFIACRFCEPINQPLSFYMKALYIEYRIEEQGPKAKLWCKIKGYYNSDISSKGFFFLFSALFRDTPVKYCKSIYVCYFWVSRNSQVCLYGPKRTSLEALVFR
jgi:hypothetical protein